MGYQYVLEIAGAEVHAFEEFGSYQGDWWAKVDYNGKTGWVHGYYGSCSGCDALQGEFGDADHDCLNEEYYNPIYEKEFFENCGKCKEIKSRLVSFGVEYLSEIMSYEDAIKKASEDLEWDMDAQEMVNFIKNNK